MYMFTYSLWQEAVIRHNQSLWFLSLSVYDLCSCYIFFFLHRAMLVCSTISVQTGFTWTAVQTFKLPRGRILTGIPLILPLAPLAGQKIPSLDLNSDIYYETCAPCEEKQVVPKEKGIIGQTNRVLSREFTVMPSDRSYNVPLSGTNSQSSFLLLSGY